MQDLRTNLAKVKGLGSAKSGVHHWWHQRFSAIILLLLTIWLLVFIKCNAEHDLSHFILIMQKPYNLVPLGIMSVVALYHGMLGMQVVIEDYISCVCLRICALVSIKILTIATMVSFVVALFYLMII